MALRASIIILLLAGTTAARAAHGIALGSPCFAACFLKSMCSSLSTPSGFETQVPTASGLTLQWGASSGATAYRIQENYNGGGWSDVTCMAADANPTGAGATSFFYDVVCTPNTVQYDLSYYQFRIRAENSCGSSAWSSAVQIMPSVDVFDLVGTANGNNVDLAWTDTSENVSHCYIYRSVDAGMSYSLIATMISDYGIYTDAGAAFMYFLPDVRYYLYNDNSGGNGPNSNVATPM